METEELIDANKKHRKFLKGEWKISRRKIGKILQASKLNFFPRSNSAPRSKILGVNLV